MENTEQITVPTELAATIHALAVSGNFTSDADVVSAAMEALQQQHARNALQARVTRALADPRPWLTSEEVSAQLDRTTEEMLRAQNA